MKTKILKTFTLLLFLLMLSAQTQAQTVMFTNGFSCDVVVTFELRDASCSVCDPGSLTIPANSTVPYLVDASCGGNSTDGCIVVVSIGGVAVVGDHHSFNTCCTIVPTPTEPDPSGCGFSGVYNVVNSYPISFDINP